MEPYFHKVWGDRRQEIVFIGVDPMQEDALIDELDQCLLEEEDFVPERWSGLNDPFPNWSAAAA